MTLGGSFLKIGSQEALMADLSSSYRLVTSCPATGKEVNEQGLKLASVELPCYVQLGW